MTDDIERIVKEVVSRLASRGTALAFGQEGAPPAADTGPALILTEDLKRVSAALGSASRKRRQALSVFVGGQSRNRSNTAGFGELYFADEARHRQIDLASQFETFFLFGVSFPAIARLAQLVPAVPLEVIAFNAMSRAKTVMMEPVTGNPLFEGLPRAMKDQFSRFTERLVGLGVQLESVQTFFGVATPLADGTGRSDSVRNNGTRAVDPAPPRRSGPVILTVRDVQDNLGPGSELTITGPYRLTDLAREYADKNGIAIRTP